MKRSLFVCLGIIFLLPVTGIVWNYINPNMCYLCGQNEFSSMKIYRGRNSVGILRLNTFDVSDALIISGQGANEENQNQMYIQVRGDGYGMILIQPNLEDGGSRISITLGEKDRLDLESAKRFLCDQCYQKVKGLWNENGSEMVDIFLVDFESLDIYSLNSGIEKQINDCQVYFERNGDEIEGTVISVTQEN